MPPVPIPKMLTGVQLAPTSAVMGSTAMPRRPRRALTTSPSACPRQECIVRIFLLKGEGNLLTVWVSLQHQRGPVLHWLAGGGVEVGAYWRQTVRSSQLSVR